MINAFNYVTPPATPQSNGLVNGQSYLDNVSAMQVGNGSKVMRVDQSGVWLGAEVFDDAPFSVDMLGNVIATSASFSSYATTTAALLKAGTSQVLSGDFNIGTGAAGSSVKVDGANNRIVINDGTTNRIVIGNI